MLIIKCFLLSFIVSMALTSSRSSGEAIVSYTRLSGEDTTDPDAKVGIDIFKDFRNHAAAAASILVYSAEVVDYRPQEKGIIYDDKIYGRYKQEIANFKGFNLNELYEAIMSKGYQSGINDAKEVAEIFVKRLLPWRLYGLVARATEQWRLSQVVVRNIWKKEDEGGGDLGGNDPEERSVLVEIIDLSLRLEIDQETGYVEIASNQKAAIRTAAWSVNGLYLKRYAKTLAQKILIWSVEEANERLSTGGLMEAQVQVLSGFEAEDFLKAWMNDNDLAAKSRHSHVLVAIPVNEYIANFIWSRYLIFLI
ncbi:hypothetical protein BCR41DRAFT_406264 [Lobosporangium transversale]|uniref:Uncharacterized protein n=1 Tax=Lobosporangium transversale TaxID=64571 RepID=A0A1Y2H0K5_9FUNG|nr:hypothetical protein BCR41DRAFT_406264 [Lobosporangium transversale]ORZ28089.1 hypothetical protein BCR41DRAFT_406264 [Lobosporangium transversale]|eukprot:XP_021885774.1 hypothetical protein BCR41DRAFT_406264 [Lobosporangium transversale]